MVLVFPLNKTHWTHILSQPLRSWQQATATAPTERQVTAGRGHRLYLFRVRPRSSTSRALKATHLCGKTPEKKLTCMSCTCTEWGAGGVYSHLSDPRSLKIRVLSEISCVIWWIKDDISGLKSFIHPLTFITNETMMAGMLLKDDHSFTSFSPRWS